MSRRPRGHHDGDVTRVLFFGDMAPSGFGTVTMDLGRAMLDIGLDVRFVSQNELSEVPEPFDTRTIDTQSLLTQATKIGPGGKLEPGGVVDVAKFVPDVLLGKATDYYMASGHAWGDWRPDAALLLGDFVAARLFMRPYMDAFKQVPTFHYVPIEGVDLPPAWGALWRIARPVATSEFGADQIAKVMGYRPAVVYHGIDADAFRPASETAPIVMRDAKDEKLLHRISSKAKAKAFFGQDPRKRWVLRTDRHMPRKNYNALLRAMAPVLASRDDTVLVLHCQEWDQGGYLPDSISKLPKDVQDKILLTRLGAIPRDVLVVLYNAADVYASTSAEGFGLTIAEAIACGVPAVGLDYSSVPEVIGPAGMVVPINTLTDNEYDHFWARPDEEAFGKSVTWLLDHPHRAQSLGALGPRHVKDNFRWDKAAEGFAALMGAST